MLYVSPIEVMLANVFLGIVGDEVVIERSGDVIPKVVRVHAQGSYRKEFRMPALCPVCGERPAVRRPGRERFRAARP